MSARHTVSTSVDDEQRDILECSAYLRGMKRHEIMREIVANYVAMARADPSVMELVEARARVRTTAGVGQRRLRLASRNGVIVDEEEVGA